MEAAAARNLTRFQVFVILIAALGLSFIIPGFFMRLESVPEPYPFLALNLCPSPDGEEYVGSSGPCSSERSAESSSPQRILIHDRMLLSSIHYVPRIAFPKQGRLRGGFQLVIEREGDTLLRQRVDVGSASAGKTFDMASEFPVYGRQGCRDKVGCMYSPTNAMAEAFLLDQSFVVPTSTMSRPMTPVSNVTLTIRDLSVRSVKDARIKGDGPKPEIMIAFHQFVLTYNQAEGVRVLILGVIILFIGLSSAWVSSILQRAKPKYP